MSKNIYELHQQAFREVAAYVVTDKAGDRVATVAFKYGRGGRTTCFFHVLGQPMAKGIADGGGYDKASAAAYKATRKILGMAAPEYGTEALGQIVADICTAIRDEGRHWDGDLIAAGFNVLQAV